MELCQKLALCTDELMRLLGNARMSSYYGERSIGVPRGTRAMFVSMRRSHRS